jgi:PST family polysaccharide transporter
VTRDIFVWWLTAQAFGLAGLPLTQFLFRALPDRGYAFAKALGLLLSGYLAWLLAMLGLAPWIIQLLYTGQFADAVIVLRWQVLGDVLKVASWPLGFVILAAGDGRTFMLFESLSIAVFAGLTWLGLPLLGLEATGIAFFGMYAVCLPLAFVLARRRTGFAWQRRVWLQLILVGSLAAAVFLAALASPWLGAGAGLLAGSALALFGFARLGEMTDVAGPVGRLAGLSRRLRKGMGTLRE